MAQFNAEIWDPGLLSQLPTHSNGVPVEKSKDSGKGRRPSIVYRIFHMGDSSPDENHEGSWGHSKRNFSGGISGFANVLIPDSDGESSDGDSDGSRPSSVHEAFDFLKRGLISRKSSIKGGDPVVNSPVLKEARPVSTNERKTSNSQATSGKKGIFSVGDESSDYESDDLDYFDSKKKASSSLFQDLLQVGKRSTSNTKSFSGSSNFVVKNGSTSQLKSGAPSAAGSERITPLGSPTTSNIAMHEETRHDSSISAGILKDLLNPRRRNTSKESINNNHSIKSPFAYHSHSLGRKLPTDSEKESLRVPPSLTKNSSNSSGGSLHRTDSEKSLTEKYGKLEEVLGRGSFATVRLCSPANSNKKYAVKEFRRKRKEETKKEYVRKLIAEFCISSSLDHENIVKTVDLIKDSHNKWCVVMEYCSGGDMLARLMKGKVTNQEVYCYTVQLIHGVEYMHANGVVHKDLKPENLLLDSTFRILKITDFGVSEVFRTPFESKCKKIHGVAGSGPYIAPEVFLKGDYDSQPVDVWSIGVIFFSMLSHTCPWKFAQESDERYNIYLDHLNNFSLFEKYPSPIKKLLYGILQPDARKRITIKEILEDPWIKSICFCTANNADFVDHKHLTINTTIATSLIS